MLDDGEELLKFHRQLHDRRKNDHEGAILLAERNLPREGLHNLGGLQEAVEVDEHENCRAVFAG